jgi:pimeloyl-ACP methyl ester carboxylesterase
VSGFAARLAGALGISRDPHPAELHWAHTRDGVRLALWRRRPMRLDKRRMPVFLCHGLGSNRADLDYPGRQSLARFLRDRGHDAWVVELRGAGRSSRPKRPRHRFGYGWLMDDYVAHDVPAAIARVRELTGQPAVHWVGHSMGGMLAYPLLEQCDRALVRSCVTVGAPSMARLKSETHDLAMRAIKLLRYAPVLPNRHGGRALAPLVPVLRPIVERVLGDFLYNPENIDDATLAQLLRHAVENVPATLVGQFGDWYAEKGERTTYGTFTISENLHRIEAPLLVIAGSIDRLTPPEDLRAVYDRVSSREKEFLVVGRESGASREYGHVDLILGERAPEDVFPAIARWIERADEAR